MTFKEKYSAHYGIRPEAFVAHCFSRCLYRHAWPVAWIIRFLEPQVFSPDYDLILDTGGLTRRRDFRDILSQWMNNSGNQGLIRRVFHIRISITRVRAELSLIMPAAGKGDPGKFWQEGLLRLAHGEGGGQTAGNDESPHCGAVGT
jgi:hypothetical protein